MSRPRICIVVTARPSWAKLQTICEALRDKHDVDLQIIACASALLERYGNTDRVIEAQGFTIAERVYSVYEGETLETSAKETGALASALASVLRRLRPACVVVCADRHEVLGAAQATAYTHVRLVHVQGGERTGSIDDKVRDSITQLADYHFVCTERAKYRVYGLTGAWERIHNTGCSSIDLARRAQDEPPVTADKLGGAGASIDLTQPFGIILQHPVTSEADEAAVHMRRTLFASTYTHQELQWLVMWPGQDAGAAGISKAIREYGHQYEVPMHTVRNLPPNRFLRLLTQCSVLVGNSSAGIREASYLGVPVVNIGTRQHGRERGQNVLDVPHEAEAIARAIRRQIAHGRYPSSDLYGRGDSGERIAEILTHVISDRVDPGPRQLTRHQQ